jgi:hypothetical protein
MKRIPGIGRSAAVLAFGLAWFGVVNADDISYTYIDATAQWSDPDVGDSAVGYRAEGSLGLLLGFYGFARIEATDIDAVDGDLEGMDLGLGWHLGLGDTLHGIAELAYTDREAGPFDEDGYTASVGVRLAPGDRWEFGVKAGYRDLDDALKGGYGEAYALWKLWGIFGLTARAELAEDGNRVGLGGRISF